ncbi:MAG: DsbA family protein [bacterium]|nr:DsbA family protein [bacterium]
MQAVRFIAWSDYLCPWCWNASRTLWQLVDAYEGRLQIEWRSYLLRPVEKKNRDRERFRKYTEHWLRIGAEPGAGEFNVWASDDPPPSHSVPAHRVAKAAARVGPEAFRRMHARLMTAYFTDNRDISSEKVLQDLWAAEDLAEADFAISREPAIEAQVLRDHEEAQAQGANGVPAIKRIDNDAVIVGAHPEALYRRWIDRSLERGEGVVEVG